MKLIILLLICLLFIGCKPVCECKNPNCGPSCHNQCDGVRCVPGEPCCEKCICK